MRAKVLISSLLVIGGLLVAISILSSNAGVETIRQAQTKQSLGFHTYSQEQVKRSPGANAIVPSIVSYNVGAPNFTVKDVRTYLTKSKQPFPDGPTVSGKLPTILSIEFMASKEASIRIGEATGLPDQALVCYVELYGPFDMSKVTVPPHKKTLPPMNIGVEVFDAQTGNLLETWAH